MYKTTSLLPLVVEKSMISTFILSVLVKHLNIHFLLVFKIKLNPNNSFVGEPVMIVLLHKIFLEDDIEKDPYLIPYHYVVSCFSSSSISATIRTGTSVCHHRLVPHSLALQIITIHLCSWLRK